MKLSSDDAYRLLGINASTPLAGIKTAFRRKAKEFHPDVNKSTDAGEQFKRINEAYQLVIKLQPRQRAGTFTPDAAASPKPSKPKAGANKIYRFITAPKQTITVPEDVQSEGAVIYFMILTEFFDSKEFIYTMKPNSIANNTTLHFSNVMKSGLFRDISIKIIFDKNAG